MAVPASFFQRDLARFGLARNLGSGLVAGGGTTTATIQRDSSVGLSRVFVVAVESLCIHI